MFNMNYGSHVMTTSEFLFFKVDEQKVDLVKQRPGLLEEKSILKNCGGEGKVWRRDEGDHQASRPKDIIKHREKSVLKNGGSSSQGDDDHLNGGRHMLTENKPSYPTVKSDADFKAERSKNSSHGKILDNIAQNTYSRTSNGIPNPRKGESIETLFRENTNFSPSCVKQLGKTENAFSSSKYSNNNSVLGSMGKRVDEGSDKLKSCSSYAIPPPYVKSDHSATRPPYVKLKDDKPKHSGGSKDSLSHPDKQLNDPGSCNRSYDDNCSGRPHTESDHHDCEEKFVAPASVKSYEHEKERGYHDGRIPLPKPRSIRRKHHKSSSSNNVADTLEDVKAVNRSSSSRRKDQSKKGLQILFDDEHHRKDDEEKMIDKLLIHYSKKPTSYDAGKLKKKIPGLPSDHIIRRGESSSDQSMNTHDSKFEANPTPARSVSLPHDQGASPEAKKVYARSNTFQPDNQAKHVHPKLPDYDDLAARFAALKGR